MARASSHDVRERLLEAGVATFSKSGFNGCSVQDITDAAGVPKGSFYNHFDSKEALGAAALRHFWKNGNCGGIAILSDASRGPRERLLAYFTQAAANVAAMGFTCGCLIGNMAAELSDHSPVIAAEVAAIFACWTQRIADCIRQGQALGEIPAGADPEALATFVLNAWEGAVLRARVEKSEKPLQQFIATLFAPFRC